MKRLSLVALMMLTGACNAQTASSVKSEGDDPTSQLSRQIAECTVKSGEPQSSIESPEVSLNIHANSESTGYAVLMSPPLPINDPSARLTQMVIPVTLEKVNSGAAVKLPNPYLLLAGRPADAGSITIPQGENVEAKLEGEGSDEIKITCKVATW